MGAAGDDDSTNYDGVTESADQPHQLSYPNAERVIGSYLHLRVRLLRHRKRLDEKDGDLLDVINADLAEVLKFLDRDPVLRRANATRPLGHILAVLSDVASGGRPALLFGRAAARNGAPKLERAQRLRGVVAHLVQTLIAGGVQSGGFTATKAAQLVADGLNTTRRGGIEGERPIASLTVGRWRQHVVGHAKREDLDRQTFEALQKEHSGKEPEHERWGSPRREQWLKDVLRWMRRMGYFDL
jgi:hypothetical protein